MDAMKARALERQLARATDKSRRLCQQAAALPIGNRDRRTSINAKWARAAEQRDRLERQLEEARRAN